MAYFMIGSPGETRAQIEESLRLARELSPDYLHLAITTPFPETDLYRMGFDRGVLKEDYWRQFARMPRSRFFAQGMGGAPDQGRAYRAAP